MRQLPSWIAHYNQVHRTRLSDIVRPVSSLQLTKTLTVSGRSGATTHSGWRLSALVISLPKAERCKLLPQQAQRAMQLARQK